MKGVLTSVRYCIYISNSISVIYNHFAVRFTELWKYVWTPKSNDNFRGNVLNCHTCALFITYIVINTLQYFCSSSDPKHEFYICYFRCSIFNMCRYITCLASNGGSFDIIKSSTCVSRVWRSFMKASLNPEISLKLRLMSASLWSGWCCRYPPPQIFRPAAPRWWWAGWEWRASSEPLRGRWCWRWTRRRSALPDGRMREMRVMEGQTGAGKPCTGGTCRGSSGSRDGEGPSKNRGFQRMPWTSDTSTAQTHSTEQQGLLGNMTAWPLTGELAQGFSNLLSTKHEHF